MLSVHTCQHIKMVSDNARALLCVEKIIDSCLFLTQSYDWLLSSSNLEFFTNSLWEKLPLCWQDTLRSVEPSEYAELLDGNNLNESTSDKRKRTTLWPLSLLALKAAAAHLSIPREVTATNSSQWQIVCVETEMLVSNESNKHVGESSIQSNHEKCKRARFSEEPDSSEKDTEGSQLYLPEVVQEPKKSNEPHTSPCLTHPRLKQLFHKHVKPKKRHEISILALTVAATAARSNCKHVIDIGSGVGHLSRMLAYGYGLKVCCIEGQETLSTQARKLDIELEATASKQISEAEMSQLTRPVHINVSLDNHSDPHTLLEGVKAAFGSKDQPIVCGIVGLHTCGDLAPILLRTFSESSEFSFINIVGCCFMKLTTELSPLLRGFPLSDFLRKKSASVYQHLAYEARAVACHANETHRQKLLKNFSDLKVHCYRATLEEIISVHWPDFRRSNIASVKCTPSMTFSNYCESALARLGVQVPLGDLTSEKTLRNLAAWKQVINVISVRLMLAPVVESIVLLDRLLFLREKGYSGWLSPLFDPRLSPRNHVLTATKQCTSQK